MHQRTIGGFAISAVGIGELRLATADARGVSDIERTLHHAFSSNLTFVEVADEDGAERMVGEAIRTLRLRDTTLVATRVPAIAAPAGPRDPLPECLPLGHVQERVEASLRASRLEALPLVMLSLSTAWLASRAWPELAGTLARLIREGKVLRWGARLDLAAADRERRLDDELSAAAALGDPFCAISIVFSACDRRGLPLIDGLVRPAPAAPKPKSKPTGLILSLDDISNDPLLDDPALAAMAGMIPATRAPETTEPVRSLPILAREPLAGGALGGTIGPGMKLWPRDDRNALDLATRTKIAVAVATLSRLCRDEPPAARSCEVAVGALERHQRPDHVEARSVAELALRFVLDRGALALPRLHRREYVTTALTAIASPPLSKSVHDRILEVLA